MRQSIFHGALITVGMFLSAFLFTAYVHGANTDIVITEIGAHEANAHEWIEILNKGDEPIDLDGWKFWENGQDHRINLVQGADTSIDPGEYALITQNDVNFLQDYPGVTSTIFDSSWGTLNEGGEEIGLKDGSGEFIERFVYLSVSHFSLERKDTGSQDYTQNNWKEHPEGNSAGKRNFWALPDPLTEPVQDDENPRDTQDNDSALEENQQQTEGQSLDAIVINELVSNPSDGEREWIELYNTSSTTIDLSGSTLEDGVGQIAAPTSTVAAQGFFVIELASSKLNNGGDTVILKNVDGNVVFTVTYGNWDDGDLGDNVAAPKKGYSIARNGEGTFVETSTPTKGGENQLTFPQEEQEESQQQPTTPTPPPSGGGGGGSSLPQGYPTGSIVINEIVSDPRDGFDEFVELYNTTGQTIDLTQSWIEDGSETKTVLSGSIAPKGFFVVEEPKGNLNNSGDRVVLFDARGKEIDGVTYGSWDDGNGYNNAPSAADPLSLARKGDGQDSNNDLYDFALTDTITFGKANIIHREASPQEENTGNPYGDKTVFTVVVNEIFPNPPGSDAEEEFIELKNIGETTVDLKGWKLGDASAKRYTITQGSILPKGYIVFKRKMTGIALNNTGGEEAKLFSPDDVLVDAIQYTGSAQEGQSYARREDNSWAWTTKPTPEKVNISEGKNAAPIVVIDADTDVALGETIVFDASDTTDPDGEPITFQWDFGDGQSDTGDVVEHRFDEEGLFTVSLVVADRQGNEVTERVIVSVRDFSAFSGGYVETDMVRQIRISEILPDPEGSDTTEFIELFNPTDFSIDLSGIKLDDEEGGSRAYTIAQDTTLLPGEYRVFGRQDTKLALNNTGDSVRLLYPDGTVLTEVHYDDVITAASYIEVSEGTWVWTSTITPGSENVVAAPKAVKGVRISAPAKSNRVKPIIETTLGGVRDEDVGDTVRLSGVVAVEPGVLGTQFFYITETGISTTTSGAGVQVYMYKKDFPVLTIGDRVRVTGEISEAYGETRVKIAQRGDIEILDHPGEPQPTTVEMSELGELFEGQLVVVHGEITEKKSSYMYLDDGTEEVKVYFKRGAGINAKEFETGDLVRVVGIFSQTRSGYQLLPRSKFDMVKTGVVEEAIEKQEQAEKENDKEVAAKYLTATAGGLTSILLGLAGKAHGAKGVAKARELGERIWRRKK